MQAGVQVDIRQVLPLLGREGFCGRTHADRNACHELVTARVCRPQRKVNAEQISRRTMRRPNRQPFRGRLIRLGYRAKLSAQTLRRDSGGSRYTRKAYATREAPRRGQSDDQLETRE